MPPQPIEQRPSRGAIVQVLCNKTEDDEGFAELTGQASFQHADIIWVARVWNYIVSSHLIPRTSQRVVDSTRAMLIYKILSGLPVDAARVISDSIDAVAPGKISLGFPCLIHQLCQAQGVDMSPFPATTLPKTGPINKKTIEATKKEGQEAAIQAPRLYQYIETLQQDVASIRDRQQAMEDRQLALGEYQQEMEARAQTRHEELMAYQRGTREEIRDMLSRALSGTHISGASQPPPPEDI